MALLPCTDCDKKTFSKQCSSWSVLNFSSSITLQPEVLRIPQHRCGQGQHKVLARKVQIELFVLGTEGEPHLLANRPWTLLIGFKQGLGSLILRSTASSIAQPFTSIALPHVHANLCTGSPLHRKLGMGMLPKMSRCLAHRSTDETDGPVPSSTSRPVGRLSRLGPTCFWRVSKIL